jgi:antitoxin HigA-1
MSEQQRLKRIHPGEIITEDFLKPWHMTSYRLARGMGVTPTRVAEILKGKRGITADTALRLSCFLGCSPEFWLGLQASYDLEEASQRLASELEQIQPYRHVGPIDLDGRLIEADTEEEYLKERARRGDRDGFQSDMARVGDVTPAEPDRL